ncbi:glycosyltransferase family 2 protein [Limosilactobacillus reuteri]|uniref:glycosyltransferase family 2 protein n=1 Tax=Limosilactobacillus reuteri TaxID=1598 RepID=UPI00223FBC91|nr:glycosyltransferase family A protein [Limosilactobacillus reuteri]UZM91087.1 glycosyltransferase family 2 protein [Limosilactobacillus reuteri]
MKATYDISIIIPTFNSQNYILDLLKSIKKNICNAKYEIILVDDGSNDNTLDISNNYFLENNINNSVIPIKHSGVSKARNVGLDNASGKFVMFFDSDDIIKKEFITDKILKSDADIISFVSGEESKERIFLSKQDMIMSMLLGKGYPIRYDMGPYRKMFNRKFLEDNKLNFPLELRWWEDLVFNFEAITLAKKIEFYYSDFYKQNENHLSLSHSIDSHIIDNAATLKRIIRKIIAQNKDLDETKIIRQLDILIIWTVFSGYFIYHSNKEEYLDFLRKLNLIIDNNLIKAAPNKQSKIILIMLRHIGFYRSVRIYRFLKRLKH